MVYQSKFIAAIKVNGQILRERGDSVHLPFGSEYSILLKNLNSTKASVDIFIDGKTVGGPFLVGANCEVEIERFVENLDRGSRFKFIKKTQQIIEHRGDMIDDGFLKIELKYEKQPEVSITKNVFHEVHHHTNVYHDPWWRPYVSSPRITYTSNSDMMIGSSLGNSISGMTVNCCTGRNVSSKSYQPDSVFLSATPNQDEGLTVKGSESNQKFSYCSVGELEEASHTIIIRLKGEDSITGYIVKKPLTVKTKIECSTCGRKSKSNIKFCPNCGTSLI